MDEEENSLLFGADDYNYSAGCIDVIKGRINLSQLIRRKKFYIFVYCKLYQSTMLLISTSPSTAAVF